MSDLFSNLTGFNSKYMNTDLSKIENQQDETDYSDVDFCQGNMDIEDTEISGFDFGEIILPEKCDDYNDFDQEG